jgi:hypothetical protein
VRVGDERSQYSYPELTLAKLLGKFGV